MRILEYIEELERLGKTTFSLTQAQEKLQKSRNAIKSAIQHVSKNGKIVSPAKGFYVIVPPQYKKLGCIPAEQFIEPLMEYLKINYYVGLLSAAAYHGAAHQAVQTYQVITEKAYRSIRCGEVSIKFITKKNFDTTNIIRFHNAYTIVNVSSPEATAVDLLLYMRQSGGLNHIMTVLSELYEAIKSDELRKVSEKHKEYACKQRLGYLLELIPAPELAEVIKEDLAKAKRIYYIPLRNDLPCSKENTKNTTWNIIENFRVEGDL